MVAGTRPIRTSETAKTASAAATAMSQQLTSPTPPAKAAPLTRATTGFGISLRVRSISARPMASATFRVSSSPAMRFIQLMSPPAEKALPAPVSTTTRTLPSAPRVRKAPANSAISASSKALRTSGRLRVRVTTPRLSAANRIALISHPEDAEAGGLDRRVEAGRNRHGEHTARFLGVDHAVIPQPCAGVIGMALGLVLLADRGLEAFLLLLAPFFAARARPIAPHRGQHIGRLLAAHHRDARIGPGPQKARRIGAAAHGVIAGTEAAADDDGEFGHVGAGYRRYHLGAVLGDAASLVFLADHEAGNVLQEDQRNAALRA